MTALIMFCLQSLADVAREEAERRRRLEQQGIEGKVITPEQAQSAEDGNLTVFTPTSSRAKQTESPPKDRKPVRNFSSAIQKIDRAIGQNEERIRSKRARLQSQRWDIPKNTRGSSGQSQSRLQEEIQKLELKLEQLRMERLEIYRAGRKAGFLPGELDGKGIVP